MPWDTPATTPVVLTLATPDALELQKPPGEVLLNVVTSPTQIVTGVAGVIATGVALTRTGAVAKHVPIEYEMIAVPGPTPFTLPVVLPTVAMAVLLLLHVPPGVAFVSVTKLPTHTLAAVGEIGTGVTFTVISRVTKQPVAVTV